MCLLATYSWSLARLGACAPPVVHSGAGRAPVQIISKRTGLAWTVDEDGIVTLGEVSVGEDGGSSVVPSPRAFHLEWEPEPRDGGRVFCLRWLRDMRLVEAAPSGASDAFMLRLGHRYSCGDAANLFAFRGASTAVSSAA